MTEPRTEPAPARGTNKTVLAIVMLLVVVAIIIFLVMPRFSADEGQRAVPTPEMTELERGALRDGVLTLSDQAMHVDRWERVLEPFEAVEFKYTMEEGQPMVFTWQASAEVEYDLHSHPFDGGTEMTESFGVGQAQEMRGLYVAPFSGIHGWYWENRSMEPVTVTLDATGGFTSSTIYDGPVPQERPIAGETAQGAPQITHEVQASPAE